MPQPLSASNAALQHFSSRHPLLLLLHTCKTLDRIKKAHAKMITAGLFLHPFPPSKLLELLLPPSSSPPPPHPPVLSYANLVFHHSPSPPLVSYNTLIKAHSSRTSLLLFRSMIRDPSAPTPNQYTFAFLLAACGPCGLGLAEAEQVRVHALKRGLETNVFVSNVVIRMYGSCGSVHDAQRAFDGSAQRDLFSWNSLIAGYVGYGDVDRARKLFDEMPEKDVVSWSTIIAGYVQVEN